jgi:hypothetical protein
MGNSRKKKKTVAAIAAERERTRACEIKVITILNVEKEGKRNMLETPTHVQIVREDKEVACKLANVKLIQIHTRGSQERRRRNGKEGSTCDGENQGNNVEKKRGRVAVTKKKIRKMGSRGISVPVH